MKAIWMGGPFDGKIVDVSASVQHIRTQVDSVADLEPPGKELVPTFDLVFLEHRVRVIHFANVEGNYTRVCIVWAEYNWTHLERG